MSAAEGRAPRTRRTKANAAPVTVLELQNAAPGAVLSLGGGLYFRATGRNEVSGKAYGRWTFRFTSKDPAFIARQEAAGARTRQREAGLGPFPEVSLREARAEAARLYGLVRAGTDPLEQTRRDMATQMDEARRPRITFADAVDGYLTAKLDAFSNAKHRAQWRSTLVGYAVPIIGEIRVADIATPDVLRVLEPIWREKTETASRLRGRIESVLAWATVAGHREGDNPARWAGNLKELLPAPRQIAKEVHRPALALGDVTRWLGDLRQRDGFGSRALEFLALTAARSGEVRGATWDEFDLDAGLWIVPADRMKAGREHRVPLSEDAVALLRALPRLDGSPYVFPAPKGGMLSDMTLSAAMKRIHEAAVAAAGGDEGAGYLDPASKRPAVPHGLRSTFRDWVAERTTFPGDMAEVALAHKISNAVEAAYRRGDMVERRRGMMQAWADFLAGRAATGGDVLAFPARGASA